MALLTNNLLLETLLLCSLPILLLFIKHLVSYTHWKRKGVPYFTPFFPFGNFTQARLMLSPLHQVYNEFYKKIKLDLGLPYAGLYNMSKPLLFVTDPELIKQILIKDFDHFMDRGLIEVDEEKEPILAHLFHRTGDSWRRLRTKLTPTFTSGKMKTMYPLIEQCSEHLVIMVEKQLDEGAKVLDIKDYCARFTTDVIGSAAFGLEINSLENPDSEFRKISAILFNPSIGRIAKTILIDLSPFLKKAFSLTISDKRLSDFFVDLVKRNLEYREKNGVYRDDFLNLMLHMKLEQKDKEITANDVKITDLVIAAQSLVFFFAGFETSSSVLSFCLYEMARHPDIQTSLRREIVEKKKCLGGKLDYEAIQTLPLLDKVAKESLRKYPSVPQLDRTTLQRYQLPNSDVTVEVGTKIVIPSMALHYDPAYYPDPERFDPERFSPENVASRPHYTYLPFGDGPRNCIGMRFGIMQFKTGLAALISNFQFDIDPTKADFEYKSGSFVLQTRQPLMLRVKKL